MSSDKVTFIRPDCPAATKAANRYRPDDSTTTLPFLMLAYCSLIVALITADDGGFPHIVAWVGTAWASVMAVITSIRSKRGKSDYARQVNHGNIVHVHKRLISVWDELRHEHEVTLTEDERDRHIKSLFSAAADLRAELEVWAECGNNDQLAERRQLAEARIRARLLHEVNAIKDQQDTQRSLDSLVLPDHPAGLTEKEVAEQLAHLKTRKKEAAGERTE